MRRSCVCSMMVAAWLAAPASLPAQDEVQGVGVQFYGRWTRFPDKKNVSYCPYFVKKADSGCFEHHYVVRYDNDKDHCYCYNPRTHVYWGRWNYGEQLTFNSVVKKTPDVPPMELEWNVRNDVPKVGNTNIVMHGPSDLPPVDGPVAGSAVGVQFYGNWNHYPKVEGVWYCPYFVKKNDENSFEHHYLIYYEKEGDRCYCYNPRNFSYWGRWQNANPGKEKWSFNAVRDRKPKERPHGLRFDIPAPATVPGHEVAMQFPPDLPRTEPQRSSVPQVRGDLPNF